MTISKRFFLKSFVAAAFIAATGFIGTAALADSHGHGHGAMGASSLKIDGGWARATAKSAKNGAAYFKINNTGDMADTLIAAKSTVSKKTSLHTHINDNGVMRMRPIVNVPVKSGKTVSFEPGGHHVMLIGLTAPLAEGSMFPVTLVFEKAGEIEIMVHVKGTKGDMKMDHKHSH